MGSLPHFLTRGAPLRASRARAPLKTSSLNALVGGEGGGWGDSAYERGGDACRLAKGCKFRVLVSLRVFWAKRHHI